MQDTLAKDALPPREMMEVDVVIVGAGPAGLATAIRLKQLKSDLNVVIVEKGAEVGAHILSGAVIDPSALDRLLPDWRTDETTPLTTQVIEDQFYVLTQTSAFRLPNFLMPKLMGNHGNYTGSLGQLCRWLATGAEALGVDIYPGFAASEVLFTEDGSVCGIATGDMGVGRDGSPGPNFTRGMELRAKYTVFAEGARGHLSKQMIARYHLDQKAQPAKFGIGFRELWEIPQEQSHPGLIQHSFGWPLGLGTGGGSFLYHTAPSQVAVGFVVHLNYKNPNLSPFDEFQRFKHHPMVAKTLAGGRRLSYGARAITEGGWQSVPRLSMPGAVLVGCAAGFVNVPRIKGSHNAVSSGMLAAEKIVEALGQAREHDEITAYEHAWRTSDIGRDLYIVRNVKPLWSRFGTVLGVALGGLDMWMQSLFGVSLFGTLSHGKPDHACLVPARRAKAIAYPKPDGVLSFDKLSSVFLSGTNHEENQPCHLVLKDPAIPVEVNLPTYGEPARLYCPAGVYEITYADPAAGTEPSFVINAQNCVHCKTCDIKDPAQNITWVAPEGGGGPNYPNM